MSNGFQAVAQFQRSFVSPSSVSFLWCSSSCFQSTTAMYSITFASDIQVTGATRDVSAEEVLTKRNYETRRRLDLGSKAEGLEQLLKSK